MKHYKFITVFTTAFLVLYLILVQKEAPMPLLFFLFAVFPFLIIIMVYSVLRYGHYNGEEKTTEIADEELKGNN